MKIVKVIDEYTGELEEEITCSGGYHIIYTNYEDAGYLKHIRKLDNGKFGDKHWIKSYIYRPIAKKLIDKFPELKHIKPNKIFFIEDMEWEKPKNNNKPQWQAKISMASKQFSAMTDMNIF